MRVDMKMTRPWGEMWRILYLYFMWVKIIHVFDGEKTSLQSHRRRVEVHISRKGIAFVPVGYIHRMTGGWYLEIAFGICTENDIIRYEDLYGRV